MKRVTSLIIIILLNVFVFSGNVYAEVPSESQSIIRKLSQVTYKEVNSKDQLSMKVPAEWRTREGNQGGIVFLDPDFNSVIGGVYRSNEVKTIEQLNDELNERFFAKFEAGEPSQRVLESGREVSVVELTGRVSGEPMRVIAGNIVEGSTSVIFFAVAPETWYLSYSPVFLDILSSVK